MIHLGCLATPQVDSRNCLLRMTLVLQFIPWAFILMAVWPRVLLYGRVFRSHTAPGGVSCTITRVMDGSLKFEADANSIPCYDTTFAGAMAEQQQ